MPITSAALAYVENQLQLFLGDSYCVSLRRSPNSDSYLLRMYHLPTDLARRVELCRESVESEHALSVLRVDAFEFAEYVHHQSPRTSEPEDFFGPEMQAGYSPPRNWRVERPTRVNSVITEVNTTVAPAPTTVEASDEPQFSRPARDIRAEAAPKGCSIYYEQYDEELP